MKRMRSSFLIALLVMVLTFSLIPQLSQQIFGRESKPANLEFWRAYSLPPAWENPGDGQEMPLRLKLINIIALNESE